MNLDYNILLKKAESIQFKNQAFINGAFVPAKSGKTFSCISPRNGNTLTDVASCDKTDVDLAVSFAKKTFEQGVWAKQSPQERKKVLLRLADLLEKNALELALLETLDMGKPIHNSLNDDLAWTIDKVRWVAECIDKLYDQVAPTGDDALALITREPVGVIGCITPWNFPLYLACAKIIPALATGNSVVLKPAEQSPLSTLRLAELCIEAGIPEGVINVLPGFGETAGQAIGLHPDVDVISFTGSTEVGGYFLRYSAESNMKRVLLECGGKSPNIILADCGDIDTVAQAAAGVFYNQGEVCIARSRIIIDRKIQDQFLEKLLQYSQDYTPGDPLDPSIKMGAMVDQTQMQRVLDYITVGQQEGAKLNIGGKQAKLKNNGYYIEPTVFTAVNNDMRIAREEIFGPVVSVIGFDHVDEAIKIANDTDYGLAASVWTKNIDHAFKVARALRAGSVAVNSTNGGNAATTFGGYKQSGIGREGSLHDFDNYTEYKTTWIGLDKS